jgi:hypothetical protein
MAMTGKIWLHVVLELGCVTLLVLQGYRIQALRAEQVESHDAAIVVRQSLDATHRSMLLCNERCGNKAVEDTYGSPKHPMLKEQ